MALNILYAKIEKYILIKFQNITEIVKKVILLMISNGEKLWYYLAVKKISALLRGTKSGYFDDFYCFNCLHSFTTKQAWII